jgi:cytochrome c553
MMRAITNSLRSVALVAPLLATTAANADDAKQRAYGAHLGRECTACHRLDGVDNGIPAIVGWQAAAFIETMGYYKDGRRPNPAMRSVAGSLDDEQVAALAAYFESIPAAVPTKK